MTLPPPPRADDATASAAPAAAVDVVIALGVAELLAAAAAIAAIATGLHVDLDDAPYRVREALLVGGEALAGGAIALAALACRGRPGWLPALLVARLVMAALCLGQPFARGWYYLLDPGRPELAAWIVFLAGITQSLALAVGALAALRGGARADGAGPSR